MSSRSEVLRRFLVMVVVAVVAAVAVVVVKQGRRNWRRVLVMVSWSVGLNGWIGRREKGVWIRLD